MYIWNEMTREEIKEVSHGIVVIPIGSTEQHGYHLPVQTDSAIAEEIAKESVRKASDFIPIILGPTIPFGHSHHHFLYPGAISLSIQTLSIVIKEVVQSVIKSGFNKVFIINSHGGNAEVVQLAAKELNYEHNVNICAGSYWDMAQEEITTYCKNHDVYESGHAGEFETALMMTFRPTLVKMENLSLEKSTRKNIELGFDPYVKLTTNNIWAEIDGYSDEPAKARKENGEALFRLISDKISEEFIKFYQSVK